MRKTFSFVAAGLLLGSAAASGQQPAAPVTTGFTDFGVRFSQVEGDSARVQRYHDRTDGALFDTFRFNREGQSWRFESAADHVGRRDQRFAGRFFGGSKVKVSFEWDQMPTWFTANARSPYVSTAPGVFHLDPALNDAVATGRLAMTDLAATSLSRDVRAFRHVATLNMLYTPTPRLDLTMNVKQTRREGTMPWMASFAFSDAIELPVPVDTRTTDVDGGLEWGGPRGMVRVGYAGSWFTNNVPTLVWDNPLRTFDATASNAYSTGLGGSRGQAAMWPNSTQHGVTGTGSFVLPANTRVTASMTTGLWRQDQALLPITANVAIPDVALPRPTAEADARTLAMNYVVTSRPASGLWLSARYRYYDFNNRTPVFFPEQFVVMDQTAHPGVPSAPLSYSRQNLDVDASLTPLAFAAIRVGYSRAGDERPTRIFKRTTEDTYRTSLDTAAFGIVSFRGIFERSIRRGSEFEEELLIEAGEQPAMRHFDIADRNRDRMTGLVQITPHKTFGLSASFASGRDRYDGSGMGLRDSDTRTYSFDADITPTQKIAATASYSVDRFSALQNSRTANPGTPQVTDPTRNWALDTADRAETLGGSLDLLKVLPRIDVRLGYDRSASRSTYVYRVPANTTIAALLPLPVVHNAVETATSDVRFYLTKRVAIGGSYWYDRYTIDDFAVKDTLLDDLALPGALYMGSLFRPGVARTGAVRLILIW